jgi:hypothetical protein
MSRPERFDQAGAGTVSRRPVELHRVEGPVEDFIDAAEVARWLSFSRDYVYRHADELGAIRVGDGPRPRLRFDPVTVRERFTRDEVRDAGSGPPRKARRTVRSRGQVPLLPVKGEGQ